MCATSNKFFTFSSICVRSTYASTAAQSTPRIISAPCPLSSWMTLCVYCSSASLVLAWICFLTEEMALSFSQPISGVNRGPLISRVMSTYPAV